MEKYYHLNDKVIIVALPNSNEHVAQKALGTVPLFKVHVRYLPFVDDSVFVRAIDKSQAITTAKAFVKEGGVNTKNVPRLAYIAFMVEEENL